MIIQYLWFKCYWWALPHFEVHWPSLTDHSSHYRNVPLKYPSFEYEPPRLGAHTSKASSFHAGQLWLLECYTGWGEVGFSENTILDLTFLLQPHNMSISFTYLKTAFGNILVFSVIHSKKFLTELLLCIGERETERLRQTLEMTPCLWAAVRLRWEIQTFELERSLRICPEPHKSDTQITVGLE